MAKRDAWRINHRLTAMMVEDMLFDPLLANRVILGMDIPPHQELRLLQMWTSSMKLDDSGFSTGKSTTIAMAIALRSVLMTERFSGIISGSFRQSKLVFAIIERMAAKSKILRSCLLLTNGRPRISHGTDGWEMSFRGGSIVRALPPNFAEKGDNLRGERWNDGYFDEWVTFDMTALTKTFLGRVTKANEFADCPVRQNHTFLSATPLTESDPPYEFVRRLDLNIERGSYDYAHFTCNYRHVPRTARWKHLVDRKKIHEMQTMNPPSIVKQEVDGLWQKSSMSYYSYPEQIKPCRTSSEILTSRKLESDVYLMAFDTASTGVDDAMKSSNGTKTDDFAVHVLRVPKGEKEATPVSVYAERWNGLTDPEMASRVLSLDRAFNPSFIMYDPNGGGVFVANKMNVYSYTDETGEHDCAPILSVGASNWEGRRLLIPFKRSTRPIDLLWGSMRHDGFLVNHMHRLTTSFLGSQWIALPREISNDTWDLPKPNPNAGDKREWMNQHGGVLFASNRTEYARRELDIAFCQLGNVDVVRDRRTGLPVKEHGLYKFTSYGKKDAAYSFCYVTVLWMLWKRGFLDEDSAGTGKGVQAATRSVQELQALRDVNAMMDGVFGQSNDGSYEED